MGGYPGTGTSTTNIPNPTPLQTALGVGTTLAGIYGSLTKKTKTLILQVLYLKNNMNITTLKRPMFRMGGAAGTGITSGLDKPRQQYANGDKVTEAELDTTDQGSRSNTKIKKKEVVFQHQVHYQDF